MAGKPVTRRRIISQFAKKFEIPRKTASGILGEMAALVISESKKVGSFTILRSERWSWSKGKLAWTVIRLLVRRLRFLPRL